MELQLKGEVGVVFGAASGLGRAVAVEFAREGAQVVAVDRDPAVADVAVAIGREAAVRTLSLTADVTDYAAMQQCAQTVQAEFGRCDHVVVTAGIGSGKYGCFPPRREHHRADAERRRRPGDAQLTE